MLYIDPVVGVIGTIAFAAFVVELHEGSWVSPCPGGSPGVFENRAWAVTDPV